MIYYKYVSFLKRYFRLFCNFILPNLLKIINRQVEIKGNYPICDQLTKVTGQGNVMFADNCIFGYKLGGFHRGGVIEFQARYKSSKINIGNNIATNNNVFFCAANYIEIGDDTLIGQYVTIMDHEAHDLHPSKRRQIGQIGSVIIGKNVWIGNNVVILKNSIIGDNTIVASGAIVSGKFQENLIIGGVPAKIIKDCRDNWKVDKIN